MSALKMIYIIFSWKWWFVQIAIYVGTWIRNQLWRIILCWPRAPVPWLDTYPCELCPKKGSPKSAGLSFSLLKLPYRLASNHLIHFWAYPKKNVSVATHNSYIQLKPFYISIILYIWWLISSLASEIPTPLLRHLQIVLCPAQRSFHRTTRQTSQPHSFGSGRLVIWTQWDFIWFHLISMGFHLISSDFITFNSSKSRLEHVASWPASELNFKCGAPWMSWKISRQMGSFPRMEIGQDLPSGERLHSNGKIHHF